MAKLGERILRIAQNIETPDDFQYQSSLYRLMICQFIIEQAKKRSFYCVLCYGDCPPNNLQPELHIPVQKHIMQRIAQWLRDEQGLHIVDQENEPAVLIRLR
jgi:hypothetical protein